MDTERYSAPARALHWMVVLAVLAALALALRFGDLPLSPLRLRLINYHKWAGLVVLALMLVRIAVRLGRAPPPLPASVPAHERRLAITVHLLMYVLLVATPVAGWLMSSAKGFPPVLFGLLPLPALVGRDEALAALLVDIHVGCAGTLAALVLLHVAAALKHRLVDRDGVLRRML